MKKLLLAGLLAMSSLNVFAAEVDRTARTKDKTVDYLTNNASILDNLEIAMRVSALKTKNFVVASGMTIAKYTAYTALAGLTIAAIGASGHSIVQKDQSFGKAFGPAFLTLGGKMLNAIPAFFSAAKGMMSSSTAKEAARATVSTVAEGAATAQ